MNIDPTGHSPWAQRVEERSNGSRMGNRRDLEAEEWWPERRTLWRPFPTFLCVEFVESMKLLTHNILKSNVKGVKVGYPLMIKASSVQIINVPFNPEFVKNMLTRIEYGVLQAAAAAVLLPLITFPSSRASSLPSTLCPSLGPRFFHFLNHH